MTDGKNVKWNFFKLGILDKVERFEAVDGMVVLPNVKGKGIKYVGILGCNNSHLNIIKDAIDKKYNSILIFEDDVEFADDFLNLFDGFSNEIKGHWDLLYLGGNYCRRKHKVSNHIVRLGEVFTTHSYAISKNVYDIIAEKLKSNLNDFLDKRARIDVIDVSISKLIKHKNLICYGFYPKLVWQRKSYSDVFWRGASYGVLTPVDSPA